MIQRTTLLLLLFGAIVTSSFSQQIKQRPTTPRDTIQALPVLRPVMGKVNVLGLPVGCFAGGVEVKIGPRMTAAVSGYYKPQVSQDLGGTWIARGANAELRFFPGNRMAYKRPWARYFSAGIRYGYAYTSFSTLAGSNNTKEFEYIGITPGMGWELNRKRPFVDIYFAPILAYYTLYDDFPEERTFGLRGLKMGVCLGF